ncbi:MAG: transglycosylase domain-containing protein [Solirubrobacteraceae bacterium]|nr:transglycosylase domain-containing protein [Patulibacter sp.]
MNTRRTRIRHRSRRRGPGKLLLGLFAGLMVLGIAAAGGVVGWVVYVADSGPQLKDLKPRQLGQSSQIFAADGTSLGFLQSRVVRKPIASDLIPDTLRQATVAVEDRRFYDHKGVDYEGVIRAAVKNFTTGETVQGGSTITMQLVRALYAGDQRNLKRKIREARLAQELEDVHPGPAGKKWILDKYLNNVPYGTAGGQEIIGVQAAARAYFNKPARDLTLAQAALIAGLPQAPTEYNPLIHPKAAVTRRNDVLHRMAAQGLISQGALRATISQPVGVHPSNYFSTRTEPFVFAYVKAQLVAKYGSAAVAHGGLKIYTTIDLKKQRAARAAMAAQLNFADAPSAALVTVDPANGQIQAMAQTVPFYQNQFNLATANRQQPGSTFKTMALMAAVRRGVVPESTYYVSKPLDIKGTPWGDINVHTYGGTYGGSMNLVRGTLTSDNTVYMQLTLDIGPDLVKKAAVDMGITSPLYGLPAESLGGLKYGVTPLEMARAYSTIENGGYRNDLTVIKKVVFPKSNEYPNGHTDDLSHPKRAKTFKNGVTGEVTKILTQNVQGGTGTLAQTQCPTAGKTGTTDNFRAAWFAGFTPHHATAIWVGYPPPRSVEMTSQYHGSAVAGGTFPALIWGNYMKEVLKGEDCGSFPKITEPNTASKFEGRYAKSGGKGTGDDTGDVDPDATTPDTVGIPKKKLDTTTKKPSTGGTTGGGGTTTGGTGGTGGGGTGTGTGTGNTGTGTGTAGTGGTGTGGTGTGGGTTHLGPDT